MKSKEYQIRLLRDAVKDLLACLPWEGQTLEQMRAIDYGKKALEQTSPVLTVASKAYPRYF